MDDNALDVVFYEAFKEEREALQRYLPPDIRVEYIENTIQEQNDDELRASILSVRTQSIIPSNCDSRFRAILSRSTGYDHLIKYRKRTESQILCGHLPYYCAKAVAEHALLLWLSLMRKLIQQTEQFINFDRNGLTGSEMTDKQLLVVGVGNIGSEVVRLAQGLGIKVWGVDLVQKHDFVDYLTLDEGLSRANIIVCAMNLTTENNGYFNYEVLKQVNQGTIFINIARGEMSPEQDLLALLKEEIIAGVGLDVFQNEKNMAVSLRQGNLAQQAILELAQHPRAILTPHNAFNTVESLERKAEQSIRQILHYLKVGSFLWDVPNQ
jgi:D-lactate dehydrogenase